MIRERLAALYGIDLRSLAAFRIAIAGIVLVDLAERARWLEAHYTDVGVLPRAVLYRHYWGPTHWSLHALSGELWWQVVLFALQALFAAMWLVGFKTRWANLGVWVLLASLGTRNQLVLQGGDDLLRMLVFWAMFLPTGARWSVDTRAATEPPPARVFSIASVALLLQVMYMYWCTAYLKWSPVWWPDGTAVELALRLDIYATWPGKWLLWLGERVRWLLPALTWGTLLWEYVGPALYFVPWKIGPLRTAMVAGFVLLHLALGATLEIGLFWMTSIACWLPFLPSWFWDRFLPRRFPRLRALAVPGRGALRGEHPLLDAFVLFCLVYVTLWNVRTLDGRANYKNATRFLPVSMNCIGCAYRLDQYWSVFAPGPPTRDGWWVIPATLDDGTEVDLYAWRAPVSWERPRHIAATFEGQRWRKFLFNVPDARHKALRRPYANWVKRRWERAHPDAPRVRKLELVMMTEISRPGSHGEVERVSYGAFEYR